MAPPAIKVSNSQPSGLIDHDVATPPCMATKALNVMT
jgi:hypothetical protein